MRNDVLEVVRYLAEKMRWSVGATSEVLIEEALFSRRFIGPGTKVPKARLLPSADDLIEWRQRQWAKDEKEREARRSPGLTGKDYDSTPRSEERAPASPKQSKPPRSSP